MDPVLEVEYSILTLRESVNRSQVSYLHFLVNLIQVENIFMTYVYSSSIIILSFQIFQIRPKLSVSYGHGSENLLLISGAGGTSFSGQLTLFTSVNYSRAEFKQNYSRVEFKQNLVFIVYIVSQRWKHKILVTSLLFSVQFYDEH